MGGALDVPGPDLSLRPGESRPDLRSVGPFPTSRSFGPLSPRRVSPPRPSIDGRGAKRGMEGPTKGASG